MRGDSCMKRCVVVVCLVLVALPEMLVGRQSALDFGRWKNFTDMKVVRGMATTTDSIWVATSGGLFLYTPSSNHFLKFTNSEGLSSNDLSAVAIDSRGKVWVGSSDGFLNALTPGTGGWEEIRSIEASDRVQKAIRTFLVRGDSLFIGTDFGVSVLQLSLKEFRDTYANLGFVTQAGANAVKISQNRIWVATDLGVASAPLGAPNLSAPTAWTTYGTGDGLPAGACNALTILHDTIIVGTSSGLAVFDGKKFLPVAAFNGKAIVGLLTRTNDVVVLWNEISGYGLASYVGVSGPAVFIADNPETQSSSLITQPLTSTLWIGTSSKGIARPGASWNYQAPNGPQSNLFSSIVIDDRGLLWAGSGISGRGRGFYRYDPAAADATRWKNYTVAGYRVMKTDDYYKVSLGVNGSIWVSSWGTGMVEVAGDSIRRHLDQTTTPALVGSVSFDTNYVVIGGVAVDSQGDSWIVDRTAVNGKPLIQLKSNGTPVYRSSPSDADGKFTNILIDRNNTKWLANSEPSDKPTNGLYYFNENDTLVAGTQASGGWGKVTSDNGLPSNIVLSLALDLDGNVCVGTDLGLTIVADPLNPVGKSSQNYTRLPLRGQSIQTIAVDAVNNKWVGTKEGVIVVNSDATQVLTQYTVLSTNGKLVDNDIRSIAFDQKRGIVYVGTEKGLSTLEVTPVQTVRTLSSLEVGPNPFLVPALQPLTIRNLAAETSIKIISTDGRLISQFVAQAGGRAFWDGRDARGDVVPSGIYFVIAFADNGNQTSTAKIAVVRR
jgi:ligand-binding sensor domain-containing protein